MTPYLAYLLLAQGVPSDEVLAMFPPWPADDPVMNEAITKAAIGLKEAIEADILANL